VDFAMPDITLNCADARRQIRAYLTREPCPSLAAHLCECDGCMLACIESALNERPAVTVPPRFAAQVLARLPADQPERSWAPVAGVILFALLGVILWWRGDGSAVAQTLLRWQVLTAVAVLETGFVLAWAWRVATRQE
jgi:hypothetical protein